MRAAGFAVAIVLLASVVHAQLKPSGGTQAAEDARRKGLERTERQQLLNEIGNIGEPWIRSLGDVELAGVPAGIRAKAERVIAIAIDLGDKVPPDSDTKIAQLVAAVQAEVTSEQTCRADKKCMAERAFLADVAGPLCEADAAAKETRDAIATERANPAGVVDLRRLHDLGAQLQEQQAELAILKPKFAVFRHRAFVAKTDCTTEAP